MRGKLYEKLYKENEELKDSQQRRNHYICEWKKRFGYSQQASFDRLLEDLYSEKYGKKPY